MVKLIELFYQKILKTLCLKGKNSQNYKKLIIKQQYGTQINRAITFIYLITSNYSMSEKISNNKKSFSETFITLTVYSFDVDHNCSLLGRWCS